MSEFTGATLNEKRQAALASTLDAIVVLNDRLKQPLGNEGTDITAKAIQALAEAVRNLELPSDW